MKELEHSLRLSLEQQFEAWPDVFKAILQSAITRIDGDPAMAQLLAGPNLPPRTQNRDAHG